MPSAHSFSPQFKLMSLTSGLSLFTTLMLMARVFYLHDRNTRDDQQDTIQRNLNVVRLSWEKLLQRVESYAEILASDRHLAQLVVDQAKAQLETELVARYQRPHPRDLVIRTVEVTNDRGMVVLRGHNPSSKGDNKGKHPQVSAALNRQAISELTVSPKT